MWFTWTYFLLIVISPAISELLLDSHALTVKLAQTQKLTANSGPFMVNGQSGRDRSMIVPDAVDNGSGLGRKRVT